MLRYNVLFYLRFGMFSSVFVGAGGSFLDFRSLSVTNRSEERLIDFLKFSKLGDVA